MQTESFDLAPMSTSIAVLTWLLLLLPLSLFVLGSRGGAMLSSIPGAAIAAVYALIWLYFRPSRFELSPTHLRIVWPIRSYRLAMSDISDVEILSGTEFRSRYGWAMRVGAGGLWGGFGLLVTRRGKLRFYVSRLDGYVLVHSRSELGLLITPERPADFVRLLRPRAGLG